MAEHIRMAAIRYFVDENQYVLDNDLRDIAMGIVQRAISSLSRQMGTLELAHRRGVLPRAKMDETSKAIMDLVRGA